MLPLVELIWSLVLWLLLLLPYAVNWFKGLLKVFPSEDV